MIFLGIAKRGRVEMSDTNKARLHDLLIKFEGKTIELDISPRTGTRSNNANRFYWSYLEFIEKQTGNNADDLHEYFKRKLLPPQIKTIMGEAIKLPATTTLLSGALFGEYLDKICALTNIPVPDPDEFKRLRDEVKIICD